MVKLFSSFHVHHIIDLQYDPGILSGFCIFNFLVQHAGKIISHVERRNNKRLESQGLVIIFKKIENFFIERGQDIAEETADAHLKTFINELDRLYYLLAEIFPEAKPLDDPLAG